MDSMTLDAASLGELRMDWDEEDLDLVLAELMGTNKVIARVRA